MQRKACSKDTIGASLIRDLKATRSTPISTARKRTARRAVDCKSPSSSCSVAKITSSSSKSVFLHDWWLIKADGKGLTIGGRTYKHGMETLFRSAVIVKRHDATTLETKDGMKVRISAKINRHNTLGNGFSIKVWNRFMLGFPCDWEQYSSQATRNESSSDKPNNSLPTSFDQVPVRNIRNLVSTLGVNESVLMLKNIYEDIQRKLGKTPSQSHPENPTDHQKNQTTKATEDNGGVGDNKTQKLSEGHQIHETNGEHPAAARNVVSRRRVFTRSMTKVKILKKEALDNIFQSLP